MQTQMRERAKKQKSKFFHSDSIAFVPFHNFVFFVLLKKYFVVVYQTEKRKSGLKIHENK